MTINKKKIDSTINALKSGRLGLNMGMKIIGAELKDGLLNLDKAAKDTTKPTNKAKGGLMKKKKKTIKKRR
tara:strand:- start:13 stop:225 length:213 start_codon:yes stop_codon:yes gene_type:complete